ncbi:MAG: chitobiase/beta-hexosaminidase C-terminal domain-containing protein [Spirochaetes bacterium]|nr:chitobiase/beta-hexosaminidase C-terminal domain-containing protein [Spirochaetota bacterium]
MKILKQFQKVFRIILLIMLIVPLILVSGCEISTGDDEPSSETETTGSETTSGSEPSYTADDPVFSLDSGSYPATTTLSLSSNYESSIYYTIDGTDPDSGSALFENSIDLVEDVTIKAIAINETAKSNIITNEYTITACYSDFTLSLRTGTTWSFHWYWYHYVNYSYTDTPFTVENDLTITLGEPHVIDDISFYQLDCVYTSGTYAGEDASGIIQWSYLAYLEDKKQLLASDDGSSYTIIFDAWYGFWYGKGFFSKFDEDQPLAVSYLSEEFVMSEGWSWSDNDSVYYPGTGTIYDPDPYSGYSSNTEKYKSGIGPYYWTSSSGSSHSYSSTGDTYRMTLNSFTE